MGAFRTALSTAPSGRILPPCMNRSRRCEFGSLSRVRIKCFSEITVVRRGCGMSSSRSGSEALNRIVRRRGCSCGCCGCGCGCCGSVGGIAGDFKVGGVAALIFFLGGGVRKIVRRY